MLQITNIQEVNYDISNESFKNLINCKEVRENYKSALILVKHVREEFEEEVRIGTFHDINDYIEYFIERCREIY